jgi:hypothetical protein
MHPCPCDSGLCSGIPPNGPVSLTQREITLTTTFKEGPVNLNDFSSFRLSIVCDVRLGDVVISVPGNNNRGVVQYDSAKIEAEETL